ncbi:MAG: replication-relaxation family protein [Desulfotomaculales bacterium]
MLTERDLEIVTIVNRFGFLTAAQVARAFALHPRIAYRRLQRLVQARCLTHRRLFPGQAGVYLATGRGTELAGCLLGPARLRLQTIEHDLKVVDVALALLARYPNAARITERELRRENGVKFGVGSEERPPDGVLLFEDGSRVAVEVENSRKSRRRLEERMRAYARRTEYKQVWYVVTGRRQAEPVRQVARKFDYVRVMEEADILPAAAEGQKHFGGNIAATAARSVVEDDL